MIPVGLRYYFRRNISAVADIEAEAEAAEADAVETSTDDRILAQGPPLRSGQAKGKAQPPLIVISSDDESDLLGSDVDSDEDIILEAGPALIIKHDEQSTPSSSSAQPQDSQQDLL